MITGQRKRQILIAVGSLSLLIVAIVIYLGYNRNIAAIEKRKLEINSEPIPVEGWGIIKKSIKYPKITIEQELMVSRMLCFRLIVLAD